LAFIKQNKCDHNIAQGINF